MRRGERDALARFVGRRRPRTVAALMLLVLLLAAWWATGVHRPDRRRRMFVTAGVGAREARGGASRAGGRPRGPVAEASRPQAEAAGAATPPAHRGRAKAAAVAAAWRCEDVLAPSAAPSEASRIVPLADDRPPAPVRAALDRELARLRASAAPIDRAAALLSATGLVRRGAIWDDGPTWRDDLARLALQTNDPQVYGIALRSCGQPAQGLCAGLDPYGWALREPDNAIPWLRLADQARMAADVAEERDALDHAARAARVDSGRTALLRALVDSREPGDAGTQAMLRLWAGLLSVEATWEAPLRAITVSCGAAAPGTDPSVRAWCATMGRHLRDRADTQLYAHVGASVLHRLAGQGWLQMNQDPMWQALMRHVDLGVGGCASMRRTADWFVQVARVGERAALVAEVAASASAGAASAQAPGR